ncbi:DUF5719 family protein [Cryobacterium sp. 10S3]|uniref:DUF5719 family protein n=1 Tax=Cryobacterium sp. 10S3 TaxID=3048582 RepID=UPI002AC9E97D|nr:DUF5719 family protein [Cryobacterium sp. 10S3]MEB0288096.1 DUF5719 family protein [Cryobacterium sp. 10S3]WPX14114.1 DUF5719 family protein [Cryobacterium sp. 10S3]
MPGKRAIARTGARFLIAFGVLGVAGVLGAAAVVVPWPAFGTAPAYLAVAPVPSEQVRVCPGPLLTLAEDSTQAKSASSLGRPDTASGAWAPATTASKAAVPAGAWSAPSASLLSAVDNRKTTDGAPVKLNIPVAKGASTAPLVAGSQSQSVAAEAVLGGLAVAACGEATGESWLVGGSTDVGRTTLVLLSNPTTVVATVDLDVFGESGRVTAPGSTGILVQPGAQRVVSLAGLAPNLRSPVVHVTTHGGQVVATLQQSIVRGLATGGVDLLGTSVDRSLKQSIAGLRIENLPADDAGSDAGGVASDTPSVRLLAPGDTAATVQIGVMSEGGQAAGTSVEVTLQPGLATDVPLSGLAVGSYSLTVSSDQPVVASALGSATGTNGRDFAWFASSASLTGDFAVVTAPGPSPLLNLLNQSTKDVTYTATAENGASGSVTVAAGAAGALPLFASTRYIVSGGSETVSSVGYADAGMVASFPVRPPGPLAESIRVYTH